MKPRILMLVVALVCMPALCSFGQPDCISSSASQKLVCTYPISGATLSQYTFGNVQSAQNALNAAIAAAVPINAAIAAQLTQLPVPSASVGTIHLRKKGTEVPESYENMGPILIDRPDTVGKGHLFAGFSYQHFNFNKLDGFGLSALPVGYSFATVENPNTKPPTYFYGQSSNEVHFQLDQYASVAVFGATRFTDLSIIIPANSVSISTVASNFTAVEYNSDLHQYSVHSPAKGTTASSTGSASGIGDTIVGVKQMILGQDLTKPAAAVGATFRFPTGDSLNYLGSGALGGSVYGLFEYRAKLTPHFKIAYQWNSTSRLMQTDPKVKVRLPGGLQVAFGADYKVHRKLTLAADFLTTEITNAPYLVGTTTAYNPAPPTEAQISPASFTVVAPQTRTYTPIHFSGGAKYSLFSGFVLYGNALIQMNDNGLRSDVVPLVGIAYNFHLFSKQN